MERGVCPICNYSWACTKRGVIGRHHIWHGKQSEPCPGSGGPKKAEPSATDELEETREAVLVRDREIARLMVDLRLAQDGCEFCATRSWPRVAELADELAKSNRALAALRDGLRSKIAEWRKTHTELRADGGNDYAYYDEFEQCADELAALLAATETPEK